ncbi:MAG: hypothetical protein NTY69_10340 [Methylococcales bacterium]|nr:hypothetical protein [Methylococcales bacterium]
MNAFFAKRRVIIYYNGAISALTLFTQFANECVCYPTPLPALSEYLELDEQSAILELPPANLIPEVCAHFGIPDDLLKVNPEYIERVDTADGIITVYLVQFTLLDPPNALMTEKGAKLKRLTELRQSTPAELDLLRRAYATIMES